MDHLVYLDAKAKELENLIKGNKSMIIRGAGVKKIPHGMVKEGDILYFINNNGGMEVKARGVVSSVYNSDRLTVEESFETIIRNQDKLQLPDKQFARWAGKQYLVLIGLGGMEEVKPFLVVRNSYSSDYWLPVGNIEKVSLMESQGSRGDTATVNREEAVDVRKDVATQVV
jgi:hypothetical protein